MSLFSKAWGKVTGEISRYDPTTMKGRQRIAAGFIGGGIMGAPGMLLGGPTWDVLRNLFNPQILEGFTSSLPMGQDPFDTMLREAALNNIRSKQRGDRAASFYTGPRGLQGPAKTVLG